MQDSNGRPAARTAECRDRRAGLFLGGVVDTLPGASLFDLAQFATDLEQIFDRPVDVVSRASLLAGPDDEILASAIAL